MEVVVVVAPTRFPGFSRRAIPVSGFCNFKCQLCIRNTQAILSRARNIRHLNFVVTHHRDMRSQWHHVCIIITRTNHFVYIYHALVTLLLLFFDKIDYIMYSIPTYVDDFFGIVNEVNHSYYLFVNSLYRIYIRSDKNFFKQARPTVWYINNLASHKSYLEYFDGFAMLSFMNKQPIKTI